MSARTVLSVLWLVACRPESVQKPVSEAPLLSAEPSPSPGTGSPDGGRSLEASCAVDPNNALRALCQVVISPPGPVELAFASEEGDERVTASARTAGWHELVLYGLTASTLYTWEARPAGAQTAGVSGTLQTGPTPDGLDYTISATGTASFPYLLIPDVCGSTARAVILRTSDGRPVWYEDLAAGLRSAAPQLEVVGFTEDGTVLGLTKGGAIVETTLSGVRQLTLRRTVDFDEQVHHDVWRRDDKIYVLFSEVVEVGSTHWVLDGFLVFDEDGNELARWRLADHIELPAIDPGGTVEYSHANAIWTDTSGDVYLSLRHLSAALKIEGDLDSPSFGEIVWQLVGSPSDLSSDFVLYSSAGAQPSFEYQHNVHLLPDGRLALFDNRLEPARHSRILQIRLDESRWTADITAAWALDQHCMFHGSAWHTAAGNPVGTCGPTSTIYEFEAGSGSSEPRWRAEIQCGGLSGPASISRAVPLQGL